MTALGCVSAERSDAENLTVTQEDFVDDIAKPIIELLAVLDSYYRANTTWPASLSMLQRYAKKKKKPFATQNIKNWHMSESADVIDASFQIVSSASFEASRHITTTWALSQDKGKPDGLALKPLTPFCILRQKPDSIEDIFLRLSMSAIVRRPMPSREDRLCLKPAAGDIKQEQLEKKLRLKLQRTQ